MPWLMGTDLLEFSVQTCEQGAACRPPGKNYCLSFYFYLVLALSKQCRGVLVVCLKCWRQCYVTEVMNYFTGTAVLH